MKIVVAALLFLLFSSVFNAQTLSVLNPTVSQGDVVIVRIAPQWQGSLVCISGFGKSYLPNQYGNVFIGVDVNTKPDKYPLHRIECGRGNRLDPLFYQEIEVLQKQFPQTKIGRKITPVDSARRKKESQIIQNAYTQKDAWADHTKGDYRPPLDIISVTDEFGGKRIYLNGQTRHNGVDLRAANKTSVKAINSGVVLLIARNFSLEGNMVILDHGSGILSMYLHLSKINVRQGVKVKKDEIIGLSGSTGSATGPHLHFIVKVNDTNIDPLRFIDLINRHVQ